MKKPVTSNNRDARVPAVQRVTCDAEFIVIEMAEGLPHLFRIAAISDIGTSQPYREEGRVDVEISTPRAAHSFSLTREEAKAILNAFRNR